MGLLTILYLIGSITFILGLKMLSNPATARKGNLLAAAGMIIAILGTIFLYQDDEGKKLGNYVWIFGGILIGTIVGALAAKKVKMPVVRKNTTIPVDLAEKAEEAGINFSATLTEALKEKLRV